MMSKFPFPCHEPRARRAPFRPDRPATTARVLGLLVLASAGNACAGAGALNDTGLTTCSLKGGTVSSDCQGTGQDAAFGRDVDLQNQKDGRVGFSFAKVGATGRALNKAAKTWACVKDQVTGLLWEVKTDDGGPQDFKWRYTNHGDGRPGDASAYAAGVAATGLCGRRDWRLPTRNELQSLMDYGREGQSVTIDTTWFPRTAATWTWTGTPFVGDDQGRSWVGDFDTAHLYFSKGSEFNAVRLVSSDEPPPPPRFVPNDAEVLDENTGLIWSRCSDGQTWDGTDCRGLAFLFDWRDAVERAKQVVIETGTAWRLPNPKELTSIVDAGHYAPTIDLAVFPDTPATWYWTSSYDQSNSATAYFVNFFHGGSYDHDKHRLYAVRLVRNAP